MKINALRYLAIIFASALLAVGCSKNETPEINEENVGSYFEVKSVSPRSAPESFETIRGAVCDGSMIKIKIKKLSDYSLQSVKISITEKLCGGLSLTPEAHPENQIFIENPTTKTAGETQYYEFYYHAPTDYPTLVEGEDSIAKFDLKFAIVVDNKLVNFAHAVELIRTPIVFAHGLASDSTTFNDMIYYIEKDRTYLRTALYPLDYAATSIDSYAVNDKVIENAIDALRQRVKARGYEVSKVNIAGHSMGGILTRLYLQSGRYRDDIFSFISIDTPHSGSQGANLLYELGQNYPGTMLETLGTMGAIVDLKVDSKATREDLNGANLNKVKVPSGSIQAVFNGTKEAAQLIKEKQFLQAAIILVLGNLTEKVYGEANDIVVPLSSQEGGLTTRSTVTFGGEWHCSVHTKQEVAKKLVEMFNRDIQRSFDFSTEGFAPPKLTYTSILNDLQVQKVNQNGASKDTFSLPEMVSEAVIFAVSADGKILDANHFTTGQLKYTGKLEGVKSLKLLARATQAGKFICSEITL